MRDITPANVAMVRGIRNCGQHHEENDTAPAIQFAQGCDRCAGLIYIDIFNLGVQEMSEWAQNELRRRRL